MQPDFVIAQISDFHIKAQGKLSYKKVDTLNALKKCIHTLNQLTPRPNLVVMTGDLTDFGTTEEYAVLKDVISELHMPWVAIPGNHDNPETFREAFSDESWLPPKSEFLSWSLSELPIHIVGLDSTVPFKPWGEICPKRMAWLDETLAQQPNKDTVILLHHHPFQSGIAHMDKQNLRGIERLSKIIEKHQQTKLILCGHLHRFVTTQLAGATVCSAPGTSHQVAPDFRENAPAHFNLEPTGMLLHHWYKNIGFTTHYLNIGHQGQTYPFYDENGLLID